jgi:hypothetical protein
MRQQIAAILMAASRSLPPAKAAIVAATLLHILKSVPGFAQEVAGRRDMLLAETRGLARLYLCDVMEPR